MKVLLRYIFCGFLFFGVAFAAHSNQASKKTKYKNQKLIGHKLQKLDKLIVGNGLIVKIKQGNQNKLYAKVDNIIKSNDNGVLTIANYLAANQKNIVYLTLRYLPKVVELNGDSRLKIKAKSTKPLKLIARAPGQIIIKGWVNIANIYNPGHADIIAHWLTGPQVKVYSEGGHIQLSGKTNHLMLELGGHALFEGSGLKAKHIWVNSSDFALAKIFPEQSLNAYASGNSQVAYLHQLPVDQVLRRVYQRANVVFVNKLDADVKTGSYVFSKHNKIHTVLN